MMFVVKAMQPLTSSNEIPFTVTEFEGAAIIIAVAC